MSDKLIEFAVKGLVVSNGKFLAVHKAGIKSDRLELPGGRMMFGETAEETLIREMKEEVGFEVVPVKLVGTWNYVANESRQVTGIIYLCTCEDSDNVVLSDEHDHFEWLNPDSESLSKMNRLFGPQMEKFNWDELLQSL